MATENMNQMKILTDDGKTYAFSVVDQEARNTAQEAKDAAAAVSEALNGKQPKGDYALRSELPEVPTDVSELNNDAGYITGFTETDPTVPKWAKQPKKPEYTAAEVGAQPAGDYLTEGDLSGYATENFVAAKIAEAELSGGDVDLSGYALKDEIPKKTSQLENDSGFLTQHQDISGKLDADKLPQAVDDALAQAKASGEFDGKNGDPGVSPTVAVSAITGGHRISITDKSGTKTVDVMDGEDGDPGDPGRGIKSIARTSGNGAAGTTDTYTITYTDNTTSTFAVRNGSNGTAGKAATLEITGVTALAPGAAPTITEASDSTAQARRYALGVPQGAPGYTPQKGVDYWTPADQEAIVQQVITALGTPVFGRVDADNNIILTGELADGTYTLKYEDAEGNVTEIGTLSTGGEELITENIPIEWDVGLKLSKTDNNHTTVSVVEGTAADAYAASQHIEYDPDASYTVAMSTTGYKKVSVCCYNETGGLIGYLADIVGNSGTDTGAASVQFTPVSGTATFRFRYYFGYNGGELSYWLGIVSATKTYMG